MTVDQGYNLSRALVGSGYWHKHWHRQSNRGSDYIALCPNGRPYNYLYIREDSFTLQFYVHPSPGLEIAINHHTRITSNLPTRVYADMHRMTADEFHCYGMALERLDQLIIHEGMPLDDVEAMRGDELRAFVKSLA